MRRYIIQEYDNHPMPGWRDLDGTVRDTKAEAKILLDEFRDGEGYSSYGTGEYKIESFYEV